MTDKVEEQESTPEPQPAPPAVENPRLAVMRDIAKTAFAQHGADNAENATIPSVDDDHVETPAPQATPLEQAPAPLETASTPSEEPSAIPPAQEPAGAPSESIDPNADYEVIVEGQKIFVKGSTIIDAGKRTLQKEAAADHRLNLATRLLEEAERRVAATPQGAPQPAAEPPAGSTEAQLAYALQFGTPEQSANAVRELRAGGVSEDRILQLVEERSRMVAADEFEFRRGQAVLHREFKDLMEKPALRRLFESEDARLLQGGDRRPYVERYRAIGEQLRKDFGIGKPAAPAPAGGPAPGTAPARQQAKAQAPSVPRSAAARLGESSSEAAKPVKPSDVIAGMAAARGKTRLVDPPMKRG